MLRAPLSGRRPGGRHQTGQGSRRWGPGRRVSGADVRTGTCAYRMVPSHVHALAHCQFLLRVGRALLMVGLCMTCGCGGGGFAGRNTDGSAWRETWSERLMYASNALDTVVERNAHKWAADPSVSVHLHMSRSVSVHLHMSRSDCNGCWCDTSACCAASYKWSCPLGTYGTWC